MFHVCDNVTMSTFMYYYVLYVFLHGSLFFGYNMNLYFGPAALHYIINNILSYLIL